MSNQNLKIEFVLFNCTQVGGILTIFFIFCLFCSELIKQKTKQRKMADARTLTAEPRPSPPYEPVRL